jgi:CPA1 family monovalent cation:H+ antiporter
MVIDQILNAALFVLIGLEAAALAHSAWALGAAALAIPLVLAVRTVVVGVFLLPWRTLLPWRASAVLLSWGGLRGGISVALALSLPPSPAKSLLLVATYLVVLFAVVVQGTTMGPLMKLAEQGGDDAPRPAAP